MEISRQKLSDNAIVITVYVTKQYIAVSLDNETIIIFTSGGDPLGVLQGQTKSRSLALRDDVLLNGDLDGEIHFWDLTTLYVFVSTGKLVTNPHSRTTVKGSRNKP